jgi:DNA-binding transcriptional regulator YiaG
LPIWYKYKQAVLLTIKEKSMSNQDLKKMREELDMTQQEFASFIDVSIATIRAWEQSVRPIPAKQARKIKDACLRGNRRIITCSAGEEILVRVR